MNLSEDATDNSDSEYQVDLNGNFQTKREKNSGTSESKVKIVETGKCRYEIDCGDGFPAKRRCMDEKQENLSENSCTSRYYSSLFTFKKENNKIFLDGGTMCLNDIEKDYFDVVSSEPSENQINTEEMSSNDTKRNQFEIPSVFCKKGNMYDKIFGENNSLNNKATMVSDKGTDFLFSTILQEEAITTKTNNNVTDDVRQNSYFSEGHSGDNMALLKDNILEIQKYCPSQNQFLRNNMPIIQSEVQQISFDNSVQNSIPVIKDQFNEKPSTVTEKMDTENLLANYMLFGPNALNILPIFHNEDEKVNIEKSDNICELTNKSNERKSIIEAEREERNANGEILEYIADINNESKLEKMEISDEKEMTEAVEQGLSRYNTIFVSSDHNSSLKTTGKGAWSQQQLHDKFMPEMQTKKIIELKNNPELITTKDKETTIGEAIEHGSAKYSAKFISSDNSSFKTTEGSTSPQQQLEDNFMPEMQPREITAGDKKTSVLSKRQKQPKATKRKIANSKEANQELHYNIVSDLIKEYKANTKLKEFTFHDITNFIMQRLSGVHHFKVLHAIRIIFLNEHKSGSLKFLGRNYTFGHH